MIRPRIGSLVCPKCQSSRTTVVQCGPAEVEYSNEILGVKDQTVTTKWRRRRCLTCGFKFSTHEVVDYEEAIERLELGGTGDLRRGRKPNRPLSRVRSVKSLPYDICAYCRRKMAPGGDSEQRGQAVRPGSREGGREDGCNVSDGPLVWQGDESKAPD